MRRYSYWSYVIFGLVAIGILYNLFSNPGRWLMPLLIFGGIFLLYKYPPARYRRRGGAPRAMKPDAGQRWRQQGAFRSTKSGKKTAFRVIRGNKRDDDEPPKYH